MYNNMAIRMIIVQLLGEDLFQQIAVTNPKKFLNI